MIVNSSAALTLEPKSFDIQRMILKRCRRRYKQQFDPRLNFAYFNIKVVFQ